MLHHGFLQGTSPSVLVATYRHQLKIKVSNNVLKPQNHMSHGSFFKLTAWRKCFMISNTPQPTTKLKWKRDPVQALLPSKLKLIECIILFSSSFLSLCFISSLCLVLYLPSTSKALSYFYEKFATKFQTCFCLLAWPRIRPCSSSSWFENGHLVWLLEWCFCTSCSAKTTWNQRTEMIDRSPLQP